MSRITLLQNGISRTLEAEDGTNLHKLLQENRIFLPAPCGGQGRCGKCLVTIGDAAGSRTVCACRTVIQGDCRVLLPDSSPLADSTQKGPYAARSEMSSGRTAAETGSFAAAVDLGSTTITAALLGPEESSSLQALSDRPFSPVFSPYDTITEWNCLIPYGSDVLSRVRYTMDHPEGLALFASLLQKQVLEMLERLCRQKGLPGSSLTRLSLAGNTIMQHLFAGIDPSGMAAWPFRPRTLFREDEELVLHSEAFPALSCQLAPCISAFIGGDITAGLAISPLPDSEETSLYLDIGTNGEMALGSRRSLLCCSVATGPAFEGAEISCGMMGSAGAISHLSYDRRGFHTEVIGGGLPKGFCGSALIDLLAILLQKGVIDGGGHLRPPREAPLLMKRLLTEDANGNGCFHLPRFSSLVLTAEDVRRLQLAKASVAAGIDLLLKESGKSYADIAHLYLAGSFGSHIDLQHAADIGLLPCPLLEKTVCLGNASLQGSLAALRSEGIRERIRTLPEKCRTLELGGDAGFQEFFLSHCSFDPFAV